MHFKNGRPAANLDPVVTRNYCGAVVVGFIHNLQSNGSACNCDVATIVPGGVVHLTCQNVATMYHAEDALQAIEPKIVAAAKPGTSNPTEPQTS
jgi:hypothetical protein